MQAYRRPYGTAWPALFVLGAAGCAIGVLGAVSPWSHDVNVILKMAGGGVVVVVALVAVGIFGQTDKLQKQLTAMKNGGVLGAWSQPHRVDVGSELAVVDGEVRPFALHFRRVTAVEVDDPGGKLVVHGIQNDGNGDRTFAFELPYAPAERDAAVACAERLAAHHGVSPDA